MSQAIWSAWIALLLSLVSAGAAAQPEESARPVRRQAGEDASGLVAEVLRRVPPGSSASQTQWIYDQARAQPDGAVALGLMNECARRGGDAGARARLWVARFWVAAGEDARAVKELEDLGQPEADAAWAPEADYWRVRVGLGTRDPGAGDPGAPPWGLMAAILSLPLDGDAAQAAPEALLLEGQCRRIGLLGPWLWRLLLHGEPEIRRLGRDIMATVRPELAAAPEAALIPGGLPDDEGHDGEAPARGSRVSGALGETR